MFKALIATAILTIALTSNRTEAQTPPTAAELSAYRGLHAAAATGSVDEIQRLAAARADLNARDDNGRTPLHVATFQGHARVVPTLIAGGANPGMLDHQRYDAVTIAAVRDDLPTLQALLASGASATLITSRYDGTALIAAAHLGHHRIVKALVEASAPLDHVNNLGWTALMEAVVLGDGGVRHTETVRVLVAAGANPAIADREGVTPLQHAGTRGYQRIVEILTSAR